MEAKVLPGSPHENKFSFSGICPHCDHSSVFLAVTHAHGDAKHHPTNNAITEQVYWAGMQCQGCMKFIFGCVRRLPPAGGQTFSLEYVTHYPLGEPPEEVAEEIPANIAADYREAQRCRFVDAHNATVEMCRRAVQASCIDLKAPSDEKLVKQIDWLASEGIITAPLKEMAHRIRLGGNLGAHPPEDSEDAIVIGPEYSDAVLEFTRDFFHHVYVMPVRLKTFTFKKAKI